MFSKKKMIIHISLTACAIKSNVFLKENNFPTFLCLCDLVECFLKKKTIFQSFFDRPACADGSRPQKPKEEGSPPQCDDGDTPVCILLIVLYVS